MDKEEYEIIIPPREINEAEELIALKMCFKKDKNIELAKIFIFLHQNNPATMTEISRSLERYYARPYEKYLMHYKLQKLISMGLVSSDNIINIIAQQNKTPLQEKIIKKHNIFLRTKIEDNFQRAYDKVVYYHITEWGRKIIPFCAEMLGFKTIKKEGMKK